MGTHKTVGTASNLAKAHRGKGDRHGMKQVLDAKPRRGVHTRREVAVLTVRDMATRTASGQSVLYQHRLLYS